MTELTAARSQLERSSQTAATMQAELRSLAKQSRAQEQACTLPYNILAVQYTHRHVTLPRHRPRHRPVVSLRSWRTVAIEWASCGRSCERHRQRSRSSETCRPRPPRVGCPSSPPIPVHRPLFLVPCSLFAVRGSLVCAAQLQLQPRSGRSSGVEAERAEKSPRPAASPSPCLRRRSCERGRSMPGGLGQGLGLGRGESIAEAGEANRVRSRVSVWFCVCLYGIERLPRTDRAIARGEAPLPRYRATCPALPCCCMMHDDSYVMLCCAVRAGRRFSAEGALVRDGPAGLAVRLPRGSAAGHGRREMQVLLSPPA